MCVEVVILKLMPVFQFEGWVMKLWQRQVDKWWLVKKASKLYVLLSSINAVALLLYPKRFGRIVFEEHVANCGALGLWQVSSCIQTCEPSICVGHY